MTNIELISLIVTFIGVVSFAAVFTILYRSHVVSSIEDIQLGKKDIDLIDTYLYESQEKVKKRKKAIEIVKTVLFCIAMVILIPVFVFSIVQKIQGNALMINNKAIMVVSSGSMSKKHAANDYLTMNHLDNQFNTYDIIILDKVTDENPIELYDVIAYKNNEGTNIIHRVVDIGNDDNGVIRYTTRGDAVGSSDSYHPTSEDVIGIYTNQRIPLLGIFILFFQSYSGIITIIAVIYCLIMFDRYSNKVTQEQEKRIEILKNAMEDLSDDFLLDPKVQFVETIYYKGYAYSFDEKGFKEKKEIPMEKNDENQMIHVIKDSSSNQETIKKIDIQNQSKGEDNDE